MDMLPQTTLDTNSRLFLVKDAFEFLAHVVGALPLFGPHLQSVVNLGTYITMKIQKLNDVLEAEKELGLQACEIIAIIGLHLSRDEIEEDIKKTLEADLEEIEKAAKDIHEYITKRSKSEGVLHKHNTRSFLIQYGYHHIPGHVDRLTKQLRAAQKKFKVFDLRLYANSEQTKAQVAEMYKELSALLTELRVYNATKGMAAKDHEILVRTLDDTVPREHELAHTHTYGMPACEAHRHLVPGSEYHPANTHDTEHRWTMPEPQLYPNSDSCNSYPGSLQSPASWPEPELSKESAAPPSYIKEQHDYDTCTMKPDTDGFILMVNQEKLPVNIGAAFKGSKMEPTYHQNLSGFDMISL
ncbi:hypothetical protein EW145_g7222 [Phellinidium pouzarii]|uniref:Uncharacterized protein n=1 Tax=Phellinidium pouzarii TaxID=167371 RepID=A0A4S4KMC4_9AGAM|nr:hypothetical protein EW145_g7222 [Phellinidium pouzarii]